MKTKKTKIFYLFILIFIFVGCSKGELLKETKEYNNAQYTKKTSYSGLSLTSVDKKLSLEMLRMQELNQEDTSKSKDTKASGNEIDKINESKNLKEKSAEDKAKGKSLQTQGSNSTNSKPSEIVPTKPVEIKQELSDEQVVKIVKDAYLTSINFFNRNIDHNDRIDDGIFCRAKDKNLTYNRIIATLRNHYSISFLNKSKIEKDCIKVVDGKVYVLALQGLYDAEREFQVLNRKDNDNYINVKVFVKSEDGNITSNIVLVKEAGKWKVDSGNIFPQR
ncbi:hypothetical protein SAMN05444401_2189 [Clostridium amylolyticum]|uniref:Uncharacterized protein n=1 Tax=Clostridium amylolyticum TaxID=1121298 RepID=A0A1M6GP91_9CLOT|nr:hypothetical protein [Clostridium amylolyticum]SHJ11777.1 hypothetical protein SAMN05444401_2189 [Clostridium amylolyticum]